MEKISVFFRYLGTQGDIKIMPKFLDAPQWYGIGTSPTTPQLLQGLAIPFAAVVGGSGTGQIPFFTDNTEQYGTLSRTSPGSLGNYLKTGGPGQNPYWGTTNPIYKHFISANGGGTFTYIDPDNNEHTFSAAYASQIYISILSPSVSGATTMNNFRSLLLGTYSDNEIFPVYVAMDSMFDSGNNALKAIFWAGYYEQEVEGTSGGYYNLKLLGCSWYKDAPRDIFQSLGTIRIATPVDFSEYTDTVTVFYQP